MPVSYTVSSLLSAFNTPGTLTAPVVLSDTTTRIDANLKLAHVLNIQGTPAYVVGDQLLPGAVGLPELQQAVANVRKK